MNEDQWFRWQAKFNCLLTVWICLAFANNLPAQVSAQSASKSNRVSITVEGEWRMIHANGLPDHTMGAFPNRHNPNSVSPQNYTFRVPAHPKVAAKPSGFILDPFGVAINGVPFDPGANEWWNRDRNSGWQYEPMTGHLDLGVDQSNAHVQPNGAYHYHGLPIGLIANVKNAKEKMLLIGWAADGFPIYAPWGYTTATNAQSPLKDLKSSYRLKSGTRPGGPGGNYDGTFVADFEYVAGAGDLDECNGRFGVTPEFPEGIYQYYITKDFPFIPRKFRGTPDASFQHRRPPGGRPPPGGPGGPGDGPPPGPPPR